MCRFKLKPHKRQLGLGYGVGRVTVCSPRNAERAFLSGDGPKGLVTVGRSCE